MFVDTDNFLSTGVNDTTLFHDSRVLDRHLQQQVYQNCTKPGGPVRTQQPMFYADGYNSFGPMLVKFYELAFSMGITGIFHDEFPLSARAYTYLDDGYRWDNRSVFLNPETRAIDAEVNSLVLITHAHEEALADIVDANHGIMVMNGAPQTRSWIDRQVAAVKAGRTPHQRK